MIARRTVVSIQSRMRRTARAHACRAAAVMVSVFGAVVPSPLSSSFAANAATSIAATAARLTCSASVSICSTSACACW